MAHQMEPKVVLVTGASRGGRRGHRRAARHRRFHGRHQLCQQRGSRACEMRLRLRSELFSGGHSSPPISTFLCRKQNLIRAARPWPPVAVCARPEAGSVSCVDVSRQRARHQSGSRV